MPDGHHPARRGMEPDMVVLISFFCLVVIVNSTHTVVADANVTEAYDKSYLNPGYG